MKKDYKYIFWDFDGTIMNTYPGIIASLTYAMRFLGMEEKREEVLRTFIGPPLRERIPEVFNVNELQTEVAVEKYREHYEAGGMFMCSPFPGVLDVVETFRKAGYIQVITTSKPEPMCRSILAQKGLTEAFDVIVGASLDGKIDTKREVLEEAFHRLTDAERGEVVLIGDTKYDAIGAREMEIDCIGITYGFGSREELEENQAMAVFDTIEEVQSYLAK